MQYGRNVDKRILNPTLIPKFDTSIRKLKIEKESKTETINEIRNYTKHIVCSQKKVIEPNGALNTE